MASLIGLVGVLAFMLLAYHLFGLFANLALLANLLMLLAIMSVFGFTLTLPGIAGIVLTMGMAVDSNVLVFERIREEWRAGRSAINAIETGFRAAFTTILDANLTTLIAAFVLFRRRVGASSRLCRHAVGRHPHDHTHRFHAHSLDRRRLGAAHQAEASPALGR